MWPGFIVSALVIIDSNICARHVRGVIPQMNEVEQIAAKRYPFANVPIRDAGCMVKMNGSAAERPSGCFH
jgi:hypothetical protein